MLQYKHTIKFLPVFVLVAVFVISATASASSAAPICYVATDGITTKLDKCPADKLPNKSIDANNGKCLLASASSSGMSNFTEGDCFKLEAASHGGYQDNPAGNCVGKTGDCITDDIQLGINVLSIGVGIILTIMLVFAGLQYATARDNPQSIQAAKTKIINVVISLVAFVFIYAFLQWIVPGGVF